jgi:hypothetical protein
MKTSILSRSKLLPESLQEYQVLDQEGRLTFKNCFECKEPFGPSNVMTPPGWRETQITGYCEACFDKLFDEPNDKD